ncbi:DNA-directed RNA polymerase subunit N [Bradyrhizobium sp. 2TAF24]|uniref:DNA-directed RNA polymerase subunit N n=1 Tax=Bradyrhizobium sp. 2TAF24 TaxID=3233011 RepID=UPI003F8DB216
MKTIIVAAALVLPFAATGALAQERAGDAALGALSGAVVLGPIGAVAGAVVGYTAGPSISRSWGMRRSDARGPKRAASERRAAPRQAAQAKTATAPSRVAQNPPMPSSPSAAAPAPVRAASPPPVQGFE